MLNLPCDATVWGGAGTAAASSSAAFHLGASGFYGQGLGLKYALEVSEAAQDRLGNPRKSKGGHVQVQVVVGKVDLFAGGGIVQIDLTDYDQGAKVQDPRNPTDPNARAYQYTIIKHQIGFNAGVVYNVTSSLHIDVDFFRAEADWYALNDLPQQKQVVWVGNAGMMRQLVARRPDLRRRSPLDVHADRRQHDAEADRLGGRPFVVVQRAGARSPAG